MSHIFNQLFPNQKLKPSTELGKSTKMELEPLSARKKQTSSSKTLFISRMQRIHGYSSNLTRLGLLYICNVQITAFSYLILHLIICIVQIYLPYCENSTIEQTIIIVSIHFITLRTIFIAIQCDRLPNHAHFHSDLFTKTNKN